MKKLLTLLTILTILAGSAQAAFTESKTDQNANLGAFKSANQRAAAELFVNMTRKDYEQLTGHHMNLGERLAFKIQQKRMKHELKKAPVGVRQTYGFNIGGFIMGLLLGPIGVVLAYLFSIDTNLRTWAWVGFGVSFLIFLLIVL